MIVRFIGTQSSRQPLGARVETVLDAREFVTVVPSGGSFQASHDDRVIIPTLDAHRVWRLRIHWPGGKIEQWYDLPAAGAVTLIEGTGRYP